MSKVKSVSSFNGTNWGTAVPLGADDENIDITTSTTQPDGSAVSDVTNDSNTALDTAAVSVSEGDTGASAWTKFNRFRKRVINNFSNYISGSLRTTYGSSYGNSDVYSANVLNNYMANVIGVSGTATGTLAGSTQTVKSAIDSLNNNKAAVSEAIKNITRSNTTFIVTRCDDTTFTFTQQDNNTTYISHPVDTTNITVGANASSTAKTFSITYQQLTPIGIGGWRISQGSSGSNAGAIVITNMYISNDSANSAKITYQVRNVTSSSATFDLRVWVIYQNS